MSALGRTGRERAPPPDPARDGAGVVKARGRDRASGTSTFDLMGFIFFRVGRHPVGQAKPHLRHLQQACAGTRVVDGPFPNTLGRSAGTRLTSPPDGVPSSEAAYRNAGRSPMFRSVPPFPAPMSSSGPPRGVPIRRILPSFRLPTRHRQPDTAGFPQTGVTLLKHLEKLPKRESRR